MNWFLCWFGIHRWVKSASFAGHARRQCRRCDVPQVYTDDLGWIPESADLRHLAEKGLAMVKQSPEL
jgi:hypothetical protein